MNKQEIVKECISYFNDVIFSETRLESYPLGYKESFSVLKDGFIYYPAEKIIEISKKIMNWDNDFTKNYASMTFQIFVFGFFHNLKKKQKTFSEKDFDALIKSFVEKSIKEYEIFVPIYGIDVKYAIPKTIGKFTFYSNKRHLDFIEKKFLELKEKAPETMPMIRKGACQQNTYVSIKIPCKDDSKAKFVADEYFLLLERTFKYFIRSNIKTFNFDLQRSNSITDVEEIFKSDIGVFNYSFPAEKEHIVYASDELRAFANTEFLNDAYDLEEFINTHPLFPQFIELIFIASNELQKRILRAIEFCGRANQEVNVEMGFLQCMLGIEALVQWDDTKSYLKPSITRQISEAYCFLVEKNYDKRIQAINDFNKLYKKRCGVAHGGNSAIAEEDFFLAQLYLKKLIETFITDKNLQTLNTIENVKIYIRDIQFQKPDLLQG